jgi:hypothetical protein
MSYLGFLIGDWIAREPTGALWLAVTTVLFFGVSFLRLRGGEARAWHWLRGLLEASVRAAAFAALVAGCYFLLNSSYRTFTRIYGSFTTGGSLSDLARGPWLERYGGAFFEQGDLEVTQYITVETQELIQPEGSAVPLYRNIRVEQPLSVNSVTRTRGELTVRDADREHLGATFNAFALSASYQYDIVNSTGSPTRAEFRFPLFSEARLYQDLSVSMDGSEVPWRVADGAILWDRRMQPGEKGTISISYSTWGMEGFQYKVSTPREILDFELVIASDTSYG